MCVASSDYTRLYTYYDLVGQQYCQLVSPGESLALYFHGQREADGVEFQLQLHWVMGKRQANSRYASDVVVFLKRSFQVCLTGMMSSTVLAHSSLFEQEII